MMGNIMEYELVEYDNGILINTLEIPRGLSHMTVHLENPRTK